MQKESLCQQIIRLRGDIYSALKNHRVFAGSKQVSKYAWLITIAFVRPTLWSGLTVTARAGVGERAV